MDEREFELVNIIGPELNANQRYLSKQTGMSLGMVNMVLRRLISKGYIRIVQLDKRKVQYLLTPKGISEKLRKSVKYAWKTIHSIGSIKDAMYKYLSDLYAQGNRKFYIYGSSDFGKLVEVVLQELDLDDLSYTLINEIPDQTIDGVLLLCKENVEVNEINKERSIDLVSELVQDSNLVIGSNLKNE